MRVEGKYSALAKRTQIGGLWQRHGGAVTQSVRPNSYLRFLEGWILQSRESINLVRVNVAPSLASLVYGEEQLLLLATTLSFDQIKNGGILYEVTHYWRSGLALSASTLNWPWQESQIRLFQPTFQCAVLIPPLYSPFLRPQRKTKTLMIQCTIEIAWWSEEKLPPGLWFTGHCANLLSNQIATTLVEGALLDLGPYALLSSRESVRSLVSFPPCHATPCNQVSSLWRVAAP